MADTPAFPSARNVSHSATNDGENMPSRNTPLTTTGEPDGLRSSSVPAATQVVQLATNVRAKNESSGLKALAVNVTQVDCG